MTSNVPNLGGLRPRGDMTQEASEKTPTFVCVECGCLSKIVRQLQNDNYCLEHCKKCGEIADKYVEYDNNLKIISVLLCFNQIYRHIFFNVDVIKNLKMKCYLITVFLLFLIYLHESKVNYRKYLEQQFITEVRDLTLKKHDYDTSCVHNDTRECPDFYELSNILQEALKNIDEEKLYTKHIFDRFDFEALITTVVRALSYFAVVIIGTYVFKKFQQKYYNRHGRKAVHELRQDFRLFYRIWYCGIVSQITFCGIIVEIIWSYNQYNFFFWLQVYSVYSLYTSLTGIFHSSYERYWPIIIILFGILISRMLHMVVKMVLSG